MLKYDASDPKNLLIFAGCLRTLVVSVCVAERQISGQPPQKGVKLNERY